MTDEEIIAVVTARMEGKTIQWKDDCAEDWEDCKGGPCWDFNHLYYRIKPEPHYRPFESAEEVMEAIKEHGDWLVSKCNPDYRHWRTKIIHSADNYIVTGILNDLHLEDAFKDYNFADGTPFGKLVEE